MTVPALARALLGDAQANAVRSVELEQWPWYELRTVRLKEAPARYGAALCRMRVHEVSLAPDVATEDRLERRAAMHVVDVEVSQRIGIATAGRCPALTGGYIDPSGRDVSAIELVLGRLAAARAAAAAPGPLPFRLSCRTMDAEAMWCAEGGRLALSSLTFDLLDMLRPIQAGNCENTMFDHPNGRCVHRENAGAVTVVGLTVDPQAGALLGWEIILPYSAADRSWVIGIGPGDGFETIDMMPDSIDYH
jgi:hypothetical protein